MITIYITETKMPKAVKKHPVENNPLVKFFYPMSKEPWNTMLRVVRVISSNSTHLIGLEVSDKNRFKKFKQSSIRDMSLVEWNSEAMSK